METPAPLPSPSVQRPESSFSSRRRRMFEATRAQPSDDEAARLQPVVALAVDSLIQRHIAANPGSLIAPAVRNEIIRATVQNPFLLSDLRQSATATISPTSSVLQTAIIQAASVYAPDLTQISPRNILQGSQPAANAVDTAPGGATPGAAMALLGRYAAQRLQAATDESGRACYTSSSTRFTAAEMAGQWSTPACISEMRSIALSGGLQWLANRSDIMSSIGPGGVKALVDVHLKETSYNRLREDAHFAPKEVVTLANFAKGKDIKDANKLAHATADVIQTGGDHAEQLRIKNAITGYMGASVEARAHPNDPAAQTRLEQAGQRQRGTLAEIAARSPADHAKVKAYEDEAKVEQRFRATAATKEAKAEVKDAKAAAASDDWRKAAEAKAPGAAPPPQPKEQQKGSPPDKAAKPKGP